MQLYIFFNLGIRREWVVKATAALLPGKKSGTQYVEGWVDLRAGLDDCEKSSSLRDSIP
jgi:hypothetical protein